MLDWKLQKNHLSEPPPATGVTAERNADCRFMRRSINAYCKSIRARLNPGAQRARAISTGCFSAAAALMQDDAWRIMTRH